jgi:hypothetical protein
LLYARESSLLAFLQAVRTSTAGDFGVTTEHRGGRLIAILVHVNAIFARLVDIERQVRRINLEGLAFAKVADAEEDCSKRQAQLSRVVVQSQQRHARLRAEANGSRSNLHFGATVAVGPEVVASGQRTIGNGVKPVALTTGLKRNRALDVAKASRTGWRVLVVLVLRQCGGDNLEKQQDYRRERCKGKSCACPVHNFVLTAARAALNFC